MNINLTLQQMIELRDQLNQEIKKQKQEKIIHAECEICAFIFPNAGLDYYRCRSNQCPSKEEVILYKNRNKK